MASISIAVRNNIAAIISAASPDAVPAPSSPLPMAVRVVKKWVAIEEPNVDCPESGPPLITVITRSYLPEIEARSSMNDTIETSIAIQRKVRVNDSGEPVDAQAEADLSQLVELSEAISNLFASQNYSLPSGASYKEPIEFVPWIQEHLLKANLFTSVINVKHQHSRSR